MTRSSDGWRDRFAVGLLAVLGLAVAALCVTLVLHPQALQTSAADVRTTASTASTASAASPVAPAITSAAAPPTTPTATQPSATPTATQPAPTPTVGPSPTLTVSGARSGANVTPAPGQDVVYIVQPGDSLWAIGQWFHARNMDNQWAAARSGLGGTSATLRPGQRILVSTASPVSSGSAVSAATSSTN